MAALLCLGGVNKHSGIDVHTQFPTRSEAADSRCAPELGMKEGCEDICVSGSISGWVLEATRNVGR